jgi:hypothetical protein
MPGLLFMTNDTVVFDTPAISATFDILMIIIPSEYRINITQLEPDVNSLLKKYDAYFN